MKADMDLGFVRFLEPGRHGALEDSVIRKSAHLLSLDAIFERKSNFFFILRAYFATMHPLWRDTGGKNRCVTGEGGKSRYLIRRREKA